MQDKNSRLSIEKKYMETTEIAFIGLGGVGGYFGFKLAAYYQDNAAVNVRFVARGETLSVVSQQGLRLESPESGAGVAHPQQVAGSLSALPPAQLYVVCVKEYDLENICTQLKAFVKPGTVILPLMNGADIYERIRKIIPEGIVLPACVYVASHIREKGIITHKGNPGKIITGNDPGHTEFDPQPYVQLLQAAGIHIQYAADAFPEIWTKFFFIASFGLVSARYNQSIGQVNEEPALHERARHIMEEIQEIALRKNIALPDDIIALTFQKAATFPYETPTSLQLDVQSGKDNTELELFAGAIMEYGRLLQVSTPETAKIYQEIQSL